MPRPRAARAVRAVAWVLSALAMQAMQAPRYTHAAFSVAEIDLAAYNGRVLLCPSHETSLAGADTCVCDAGFYRSGGACVECARGHFKPDRGDQACTPCGAHSDSLPGASSQAECLCVPGYTLNAPDTASSTVCQACAAGKYKPFTSNALCVDCPQHTANSGGGAALTSCQCSPGYTGEHGGPCTACLPGTFKPDAGAAACAACASDSYAPSTTATACTDCPAGTSTYSATGGDELADCLCTEGLQPDGHGLCETCEANHYCPGQSAKSACQSPGGLSPAGSTAFDDCFCAAGYYLHQAACVVCTPDFYCPEATAFDTRQPCPPNSLSPAGVGQQDACVCDPGYQAA